jgi:hypothetical protein
MDGDSVAADVAATEAEASAAAAAAAEAEASAQIAADAANRLVEEANAAAQSAVAHETRAAAEQVAEVVEKETWQTEQINLLSAGLVGLENQVSSLTLASQRQTELLEAMVAAQSIQTVSPKKQTEETPPPLTEPEAIPSPPPVKPEQQGRKRKHRFL